MKVKIFTLVLLKLSDSTKLMAFYIWSNQIILCGLFVCFCAVQSGTCKKRPVHCADQTVQVINRKSFDLKRNEEKLEGVADVSSFEKKWWKVKVQIFLVAQAEQDKYKLHFEKLHLPCAVEGNNCNWLHLLLNWQGSGTEGMVKAIQTWHLYSSYGLEIYRGSDLSTGNLPWSWTLQGASWGAEEGAFPTFQTSYICQVVYRCVRWTCAMCNNGYPLFHFKFPPSFFQNCIFIERCWNLEKKKLQFERVYFVA